MNRKLGPLETTEPISRFIFSKSHFNRSGPKYGAFLPASDGDTSCFRVKGLSEDANWEIGRFVGRKRGKDAKGRANVNVEDVSAQGLTIDPDACPHLRHVNMTAWPDEESARKLVAIELAKKAQLILPPKP